MKKIASVLVLTLLVTPAFGAGESQGRRTMVGQMTQSASNRTSLSVGQMQHVATLRKYHNGDVRVAETPAQPTVTEPVTTVKDRSAEREACLNNNVGVQNTFVWASRLGNTTDYAYMVEDTENPDNNACFVRVDIKSANPKVDLSDVSSKYYELGSTVECGSWVDEEDIRQRILQATKGKRAAATAVATIGSAALGVGAMEAFGNKLIGGKIEGQKAKGAEVEIQQYKLAQLKASKAESYETTVEDLKKLQQKCAKYKTESGTYTLPACNEIKFDSLLEAVEKAKQAENGTEAEETK